MICTTQKHHCCFNLRAAYTSNKRTNYIKFHTAYSQNTKKNKKFSDQSRIQLKQENNIKKFPALEIIKFQFLGICKSPDLMKYSREFCRSFNVENQAFNSQ